MIETKFTNGEWVVDSYASIDNSVRVMQGNFLISYSFIFDDAEEVNANAHLIAAAPEMYEEIERDIAELKEFILTLKEYSNDWLFYNSKLSGKELLLAKARGEV